MINNVDDLENLDPNDIIISMDDNIELELKYHKDLQWLDYERSGHTGFMPSDPSNLNDFDSEATNEQIELFGNDSANPGKISLATLKLKMNDGNEKSFASSINISQNPQTGVVTFQLYSKDNTLLDTKTLDLDTEHIIKSISLNYAQKKLIFTMADNTTLECDISDLIDTLQNNINNVSNAKADKVVNGVENNIVLLDSNGNIKDSGKSINDVGKVASVSIGGATPIQPDQNKNIDLPAYPTKNSLGLNNVDNTSDINKPISTAQQTALDLKEDKSNKVASWSDTPNNTNYPSEKLVKDALDLMNQALNLINGKIPSQASAQNQLADKDYVNSSIATNTATFKGTYNSINDLPLTNVDANDYAYVITVDDLGNTAYNRYKYVEGTGWAFEYTLNNSSFTAEQWATINSGMTLALKNQITTNQQDIAGIKNGTTINNFNDVEGALANKQDKIDLTHKLSADLIEENDNKKFVSVDEKGLWNDKLDISGLLKYITYAELKSLRDNSQLVKGRQYCITDYQCTTVTTDTLSAGHQFDIIVVADDVNVLNENARACLHSGDTYFANSKLEAWELKYCIDNDTTRFNWADTTNGKGVIYYMKDEFNNECPYDFKNILFHYRRDSSSTYYDYFTFSHYYNSTMEDSSLTNNAYNNKIEKSQIGLNFIVIVYFGGQSYFQYNNTFGENCYNYILQGANIYNNKFGNNCHDNFGEGYNITLANNCYNNSFGGNNIKLGNNCHDNVLGSSNSYIELGDDCSNNLFGSYIYRTILKGNNSYIKFGDENNIVGDVNNMIIDNGCKYLYLTSTSQYQSSEMTNIHICLGVTGNSSSNRKTLDIPRATTYVIEYKANDTTEVLI